ncbi:hypothetical protein M0R45_019186 [Rubus argutus]|uniref:Uncharacterized protein n=1 Tax=Rubus argutus TaxID=59490 RepID=A0AAW1X5I2_RUBAR
MVGPTYKTDGFGFAFPLESFLVSYISRAILTVTQNKTQMDTIQSKYFLNEQLETCEDQSAKIFSKGPSLGVHSFGGLFIIIGVDSMISLLMDTYHFFCAHWPALTTICSSESTLWAKVVGMAKYFDKKGLTSHQFTNSLQSACFRYP